MKALLLIRHAKSSWDFDVDDFDRPLNHRGQNDAPLMAKRLIQKDVTIDCFISSPAKRAVSTAAFFVDAYNKNSKEILTISSLYEPTIEAFYNAVESVEDDLQSVAVFSHNPIITDFANQLTSFKIDEMPTCAIFAVKAEVKKWKDFRTEKKDFWFFEYPKSDQ